MFKLTELQEQSLARLQQMKAAVVALSQLKEIVNKLYLIRC